MSVDYATAGTMLEAFGQAWQTHAGDLLVSLFSEDAEYHDDPFTPAKIGHNAIRAYLLDDATTSADVDFVTERHWVSGDTVLAAWHLSYTERTTSERIRLAGFMTWEMASDGRIARLREWALQAPSGATAG